MLSQFSATHLQPAYPSSLLGWSGQPRRSSASPPVVTMCFARCISEETPVSLGTATSRWYMLRFLLSSQPWLRFHPHLQLTEPAFPRSLAHLPPWRIRLTVSASPGCWIMFYSYPLGKSKPISLAQVRNQCFSTLTADSLEADCFSADAPL